MIIPENEKMNRREFIKENFLSSIGFLMKFIDASMTTEVNYIRPPGAQEEWDFLTSCTRCGVCQDSCPEGIISLFSTNSGVKLTGTPYLNLTKAACTFCNKCIETCPTEALTYGTHAEVLGTAKVIKKNCITFEGVMCDYCIRSCPVNALVGRGGQPEVDVDICIGCGICIAACIEEYKGITIVPRST